MKSFLVGAVVGSAVTLYSRMVVNNTKAAREYDRQMTELFNAVPREQRYGYTEDFPASTKWQL